MAREQRVCLDSQSRDMLVYAILRELSQKRPPTALPTNEKLSPTPRAAPSGYWNALHRSRNGEQRYCRPRKSITAYLYSRVSSFFIPHAGLDILALFLQFLDARPTEEVICILFHTLSSRPSVSLFFFFGVAHSYPRHSLHRYQPSLE